MNLFKKILLLSFAIFLPYSVVNAEEVQMKSQYTVIKTINVRSQAKIGNNRIGHLKKGDMVMVKKIVNSWCEIDYRKYQHAYVSCKGLALKDPNPSKIKNPPGLYDNCTGDCDPWMTTSDLPVLKPAVKPGIPLVNYGDIPRQKNASGNWTLGSENAPLKLEEFMDYQCEFCTYYLDTAPDFIKNHIATGKVQYIIYHYPLTYHLQSEIAAEAAFCGGEQHKFWEMHDLLLKYQDLWSDNENYSQIFNGFVRNLKLDKEIFNKCIAAGKFQTQIQSEHAEGEKRKISGVSAFFLNGKELKSREELIQALQ